MKRLLIIDSDARVRESLRAVFAHGYALTLASEPAPGTASLNKTADLLILGLDSPTPTEVQRRALSDAGIPVLGLSVSPLPLENIAIIAKPFDVEEIRAKVAELIQANPCTPPPDTAGSDTPINLEKTVNDFERRLIVQALEKCGGIQTRTAERLGTTRRILRYRMDKLGIAAPARKQS
jgi:DNA-binding NtrC family response regulator